jgi:endonuclease/exonuclease/phosphatase family metal-dependent hydrolase
VENQDQSRDIESRLREIAFVDRVCEAYNHGLFRLVHWNIEKGKRWNELERCLDTEALLSADILTLNEADAGMARSGNRHVALDIAEHLGMRVVFAPSFYEFTKGIGEERLAPGENSQSIQGNALLSRLAILEFQNLRLPECYDPSHAEERRAGGRTALIARLHDFRGFNFTVAVTHLEVYATRDCRAKQMDALLSEIGEGPAIIAGDFNTNTFDRGSRWNTFQSLIALLRSNVKMRVSQPWEWEPLFDRLESRGFTVDQFNDCRPTNTADLTLLEDRKHIPSFIVQRALKRGRYLPLRLDWIVCRGFRAMSPGQTLTDLPCQPSDHLPITCDLVPLSGS